MKTIKKSLLAVFMLTVFMGHATLSTPTMVHVNLKKTTLQLNNVKPGQKLVMKDQKGQVLYREPIEQSGVYSRDFDLSSLPSGEYSFELDQGFAILIVPFNVLNSTIVFQEQKKKLIIKPIISIEKNKVKIGRSPLTDAPIKVRIYFESEPTEIIYRDEIEPAKKGFRTYTLQQDVSGQYRVVYESEGRVYTKQFKI